MKKTSFVVLTIVLAIALMGAGYAIWDGSLTINNTVNTGYLSVSFVDASGIVTPDETTGGYIDETSAAVVTASDTLTVNIDNAYPGAIATVSADITNDGTVPAKVTFTDDFATACPDITLSNVTVNGVSEDTIEPGATVTVQYTITVGEDALPSEDYTGIITAKTELDI